MRAGKWWAALGFVVVAISQIPMADGEGAAVALPHLVPLQVSAAPGAMVLIENVAVEENRYDVDSPARTVKRSKYFVPSGIIIGLGFNVSPPASGEGISSCFTPRVNAKQVAVAIGQRRIAYDEASNISEVSGGGLPSVFDAEVDNRIARFGEPKMFIWDFNGQVCANLSVPDVSIIANGFFGVHERAAKHNEAANTDTKAGHPDDEHHQSPEGHILLGLQILIGAIFLIIGINFLLYADSDILSGYENAAASSRYFLYGLCLICLGIFLIFSILATASLIL